MVTCRSSSENWQGLTTLVEYIVNKAHAVLYAIICYQTMWLKLNYPECFYAALMTAKGDNQDKISVLVNECRAKGIKINPPDINVSTNKFVVTEDGINYRITTIAGVGEKAIQNIEEIRPITSLDDLLERRTKRYIKNNNVTNLIKAGCFDKIDKGRNELLKEFLLSQRTKTQIKNNVDVEYEPQPYFQMEDDVLGLYLTDNPLDKFAFKPMNEQTGEDRLIGGKLVALREIFDKNGNQMAFASITTKWETVDVVIFASTYPQVKEKLVEGQLYLVKGRESKGSILLNILEVLT